MRWMEQQAFLKKIAIDDSELDDVDFHTDVSMK